MSLPWPLVSSLIAASLWLAPAGARAQSCPVAQGANGNVSDDGAVEVFYGERSRCKEAAHLGDQTYPHRYWTTQDLFWGVTAGCPDGMVDGVRRHWIVTGPGEDPVRLYDAPGCVTVPVARENGSVDALDIEAVLRGVLPQPAVARDPYADGLVGLETYFWYAGEPLTEVDHDGDQSTAPRYGWTGTTSRDGITVTATLYVKRFAWQVEAGHEVSAAVPGDADEPAAEHTYSTTGTYELVASTTWTGSYSWTIDVPGGADPDAAAALSGTGTLNGVTLSSTPQPFRVREIRSVPADTGS